ncbi:serine/threonine-protein kinase [Sebaldella termitidis]|nr:serine/threonine-protein kinase [Sebaldella termitidis]
MIYEYILLDSMGRKEKMIIFEGKIVYDEDDNEYCLEKQIGEGGFGKVYLAKWKSDNKKFAIKILDNSFSNEKAYTSFINEITLASKISSRNVIKYEYTHTGEIFKELGPYIIMEYADNGSLEETLVRQKKIERQFSNEELKNIFLNLAKGMKDINSKLIHRDIKPENILWVGEILKISDFGISKVSSDITRTKTFKGYGSKKYSAPEVWQMDRTTIKTDIYSMGIVFYELATLNYPYEVKNSKYNEVHLYKNILPLQQFNENLSVEFIVLINKMLKKKANERFENWDEIIDFINTVSISEKIIELEDIVNEAVSKQILCDIEKEKESLKIERRNQEKTDFYSMVYYQYKTDILEKISEFGEKNTIVMR